jgi:hypothetical protein
MKDSKLKNFLISMTIFFVFFLILDILMILMKYWSAFGKESILLMVVGFLISAIINIGKS